MASSSSRLLASAELVKQGAEAKVYKCYLHPSPSVSSSNAVNTAHVEYSADACAATVESTSAPVPVLLKHRFPKQYRHPTLNATLTRARVAAEARALMKCLRSGVNVPGIRMVDAVEGLIAIEWIEGHTVRSLLGGGEEIELDDRDDIDQSDDLEDLDAPKNDSLFEYGLTQADVMNLIGTEIAKMHIADIIHGDLTTSNMMIRHSISKTSSPSVSGRAELLLIDFGLASQSSLTEDKAVDLYVLERTFTSTHPDSEPLFASVLRAYEEKSGKDWKPIKRKLDEVRLRGRKRSMVG